jgi:hypothetical protein
MIRMLALVSLLALAAPVLAADLAEDATVPSVLEAAKGSKVTLRLVAGDEMTGKVAFVGADVVKLVELSGREFFEAVVDLEDVVAVITRTPGAAQ